MDQFHEYLYADTFVIYTDNNLLTNILTNAKFDAAGHHWVGSWQIIILPSVIDQEREITCG